MAINNMKITIKKKAGLEKIPMGGRDKAGNCYEVNNKFLTQNGKPLLPIMGEFHFSRWMSDEWEEALLKMRAGGVNIVATYVFWIHHEERKGEWDFSGSRDIRAFLEVCRKINMPVWLRIGPWAHGECRNGGFPDWLVEELGHNGLSVKEGHQGEVHEARTNDALYMKYVTVFWEKLSEQVKGMMCKDGGPVLGIQLENEYCHAGGPADKTEGVAHMKALKELALKLGFETPYYTATGWGGAIVLEGETLPVLGGYVDAPWAGHIKEMPACENFLFSPFHVDENIGADLADGESKEYTFSKEKNPYLTAELGGGLQVTSHRRTYPFPQDIEAQSICMLGAGANLLGYYMYHGGVNPEGKYSTLQESRETGYFNELPKRSYDFQTCIRESGKLNESYHRLKRLHMMIAAFTDSLAPANAYSPDVQPENAEDLETPRISVRYNQETQEGFLFINNHQRLRTMKPIVDLSVEIAFEDNRNKKIVMDHISCASGACAVIPFGLRMGNSRLVSTNARLLTRIGERYFFYYDANHDEKEPYFHFEGEPYKNMVVLTEEEAKYSYVFADKLYLTRNPMFQMDNTLYMLTGDKEETFSYYEETGDRQGSKLPILKNMTQVSVSATEDEKSLGEDAEKKIKKYDIFVERDCVRENCCEEELHEIYLHINFAGDRAELFDGDRLLTDWFSNGEEWVVALKRYDYPQKLRLVVYSYEEAVYYDLEPRKGCELISISAETEYKRSI